MMYVVMGIAPHSQRVVDWFGNIEDARICQTRCVVEQHVPSKITYKIFFLTEIQ